MFYFVTCFTVMHYLKSGQFSIFKYHSNRDVLAELERALNNEESEEQYQRVTNMFIHKPKSLVRVALLVFVIILLVDSTFLYFFSWHAQVDLAVAHAKEVLNSQDLPMLYEPNPNAGDFELKPEVLNFIETKARALASNTIMFGMLSKAFWYSSSY